LDFDARLLNYTGNIAIYDVDIWSPNP